MLKMAIRGSVHVTLRYDSFSQNTIEFSRSYAVAGYTSSF